ncbi:hypothetical protein BGZ75_000653 [Mortierella antarctica]|nr:hypothetical protein BGZ67_005344 [Mortierella alpina]KAF9987391.1 hypothetical protein BGZ75_000653 [Mortierella antarctica]
MSTKMYIALRPLRFTIGLLSLVNFMILATALRFSERQNDFMDFQQIIINGCLFIACIYSFFGRATWSPTYRLTMIWIISVLSLIYSISLLVKIENHGGCSSTYFTGLLYRCRMQYVISGIELFWTVALLAEGMITYRQSRDQEWQEQIRMEEEAQAQANAVHYQPDLSLYGPDGGPGLRRVVSGGDGFTHTGPSALEMEPLPVYMPRANKDQPQIIDMANLGSQQQQHSEEPTPTYQAPPTTPPPAAYASGSNTALPSSSASSSAGQPLGASNSTGSAAPASASIPLPTSGPPSYIP